MNSGYKIEGVVTSVTTAYTVLVTSTAGSQRGGGEIVNLEVVNLGATAFSNLKIQLRDHPNGEWYDYLGASDFASSSNFNMLFSTVGPDTLAGGAKGHICFRVNSADGWRVAAEVGSGTTTAQARAQVRME